MGIWQKIVEAIRGFARRRREMIVEIAVTEARSGLVYAFEELEEQKPNIAKGATYEAIKAFVIAQFDEQFDDLVRQALDRLIGPA